MRFKNGALSSLTVKVSFREGAGPACRGIDLDAGSAIRQEAAAPDQSSNPTTSWRHFRAAWAAAPRFFMPLRSLAMDSRLSAVLAAFASKAANLVRTSTYSSTARPIAQYHSWIGKCCVHQW